MSTTSKAFQKRKAKPGRGDRPRCSRITRVRTVLFPVPSEQYLVSSQRSPWLQLARTRDAIPIARKPPITDPDQPVESRQTEDSIERPCPPDPPRHIEIHIGSGNQVASRRQQPYVGD